VVLESLEWLRQIFLIQCTTSRNLTRLIDTSKSSFIGFIVKVEVINIARHIGLCTVLIKLDNVRYLLYCFVISAADLLLTENIQIDCQDNCVKNQEK